MTPTLLYRGFLKSSSILQLPISPKRLSLQAEVLFPCSCVPRGRMRSLKHQQACVRKEQTESLAASWEPIKGHTTLSLNTSELTYKQNTGLLTLSHPSASQRR